MPPEMKSIQQKHVTDHRATYRYKPQRAILIIAFQKISQLVFRISEKVQFHRIALILYHIFFRSSIVYSYLFKHSITDEVSFHTSSAFSLLTAYQFLRCSDSVSSIKFAPSLKAYTKIAFSARLMYSLQQS